MRISLASCLLLSAAFAAALGGCASGAQPEKSASAAAQTVRITGTVAWRERIAVPADAQVTVRLQDVSRADAPAPILAEQRFATGSRQPPYPFELSVDASRISASARYTVAARVEYQGRLLFISDTAYPVINSGGLVTDMVLVRVQSPPR